MMFLKSLAKANLLARRLRRDARGATAIEYGVLAAALSMAAVPAAPIVKAKASDLGSKFERAFGADFAVMKKKAEWMTVEAEKPQPSAAEPLKPAAPAQRRWFRFR